MASYDGPPTEIGVFSNKREAKEAAVEWAKAQEMEDEKVLDIEVDDEGLEADRKASEEALLDDDEEQRNLWKANEGG